MRLLLLLSLGLLVGLFLPGAAMGQAGDETRVYRAKEDPWAPLKLNEAQRRRYDDLQREYGQRLKLVRERGGTTMFDAMWTLNEEYTRARLEGLRPAQRRTYEEVVARLRKRFLEENPHVDPEDVFVWGGDAKALEKR
jgi:hypothetical protein